ADPTKVKVGEREHAEEEEKLLDSTVGRVALLLPVAPARLENKLEASVERLFDEGGSTDQVDSATDVSQEVETGIATGVRIIAEENAIAVRPKRLRKKRQAATDAIGSSHPPKKLRRDYRASSETTICGKSPSALREVLASSLLNVEVSVAAMPTLLMVTSLVSATPKHESGAPADSITGLNIRNIGASERFVISLDSSRHSSIHASEAKGDYIARSVVVPLVITEVVVTSHAIDFPPVLEIGIMVTSPNVLNDSLLDDYDVSREFVNHLSSPALFPQIREMDYHHLFTEFNVGTARQAYLNAKVRMRTEYCLSERKRLESECEKQADLLKVRDAKIESLKAQLLLKETEAAKAVHLCAQVHELEATYSSLRSQVSGYERLKKQIEEFQYAQINIVNDKVAKLDADLLEMALHLEENFIPTFLTLFLAEAGIDHGKAGRSLEDVAAYNPSAEVDYTFALQRIRKVDFPLLAELKSRKDASTVDVIDLLCLEVPLADAPRMSDFHMPVTAATTTVLSVTFASASTVPPITLEDYEIMGTDGPEDDQRSGQGEAASFPYTVKFEKEELDTTPERDPPS
nr:hypothetical protein [Tanacetum cinerariifolium]